MTRQPAPSGTDTAVGRRPAADRTPSQSQPQPQRPNQGPLGRVVAGSLVAGVVAAAALVAAPVVPADEDGVTGAVLVGFAAGWALLAVASARFTACAQRWAVVPAVFLGLGGAVLLAFGAAARPAVDRSWPVAGIVLAAWLTRRVAGLASRGGRLALWPVVALLLVASVGAGWQSVGAAVDDARRTMPGRLVDVGGHRLHLVCTGSGSPTVVLEPGAGEMAANLGWISPAVARTTRVCAYDRAGRGWSDPTDRPQNGARVADDLHTLLHRAGVPGPYVLAGHSFGGLYVQAFAARYPEEVAGLVLVDSTAPASAGGMTSRTPTESGVLARVAALVSATSRVGVSRLYAALAFGDLPAASRDDVRAAVATSATVRSTIDEYLVGAASMRDAAALHDLGDTPLVVLTAGAGHPHSWFTDQEHLATLSTRTVHRVVDGATHEGLVAEAGYAAVTSQAITDVVATVRARR